MFRKLLCLFALFGASSTAEAQTILTGGVSDATVGPLLSGQVYHVPTGITVSIGQTLTIEAGAILKFGASAFLHVPGTIDVQGTAGQPVIFTSLFDDEGFDSNGDGPTVGMPGEWTGIVFQTGSDASTVSHAEIRFAGASNTTALRMTSTAPVAFNDLLITDCADDGLSLSNAGPIFTDTHFHNVGAVAIEFMPLHAAANFTGTTASGTGLHRMSISSSLIAGNVTLTTDNTLNGVFYMVGNLAVPVGASLTLEKGLILKMAPGLGLDVNGVLNVNGTLAAPVHFTSHLDDLLGGDTDGGGNSTGTAGDWNRVRFGGANPSSMTHCTVQYAGSAITAGLFIFTEGHSYSNMTVRDCVVDGMHVFNDVNVSVTDCHFEDNGGLAIRASSLNHANGFVSNSAVNNAGGNTILFLGTTLDADLTLDVKNGIGNAISLAADIIVPTGMRLTVPPGMILKGQSGLINISNGGACDFLGTAAQPIILTSFMDDEGIDSNGDGAASLPMKGDWRGVFIQSTAMASTIEHVEIRYSGRGTQPALDSRSSLVSLRHIAVRRTFRDAFSLTAFAEARGLLAWDCFNGFSLFGAGDVVNATAARCSNFGFDRAGGATQRVINSISWNNTAGDFDGLGGGSLLYTDGAHGLGGISGNISADPLFVDEPNGDLRLQFGSPCIDAGDPLSPLDPDTTRADMGAIFFDQCEPRIYCTAKVNSQGCTPQIGSVGSPSASGPNPFDITAAMVINDKNGVLFYGLGGAIAVPFQGGTLCVQPPLRRTAPVNSGGNPPPDDCSGLYSFDFNARIQSGVDPFLVPGALVSVQYWMRDGAQADGTGVGLTDAIQFRICP